MSLLLEPDNAFFDLAQRRNVLFYHKGYFSHNIVASMGEVVRLQLEVAGVTGPTRRKLFSAFVELSQNIVHYSSDALQPDSQSGGAIREGAVQRIRPKVMAVCAILFGLLPIMWSPVTQSGADVMKRIAAPMIGGVITSGILELLLYPVIYLFWRKRHLPSVGHDCAAKIL